MPGVHAVPAWNTPYFRVYISLERVLQEIDDWQFQGRPAKDSLPRTIGALEKLKAEAKAEVIAKRGLDTYSTALECAPPVGYLFIVEGNQLGLGCTMPVPPTSPISIRVID